MGILATSQVTIVDLNDQLSLSSFLTSSAPKVQFVATNGTSFTPSFSASAPLVINAELYKIGGSAGNIISNSNVTAIRWYRKLSGATSWTQIPTNDATYEIVTVSGKTSQLKVKANVMTKNAPSLSIKCEIDYKEIWMPVATTQKVEIDYSLSVQGNTGATGSTGASAYTVVLSNETHAVACNKDGVANSGELGSGGKASSTITVYQGATKLTAVGDTATPTSSQFKYVIGSVVGGTAGRTGNDTFHLATITADSGKIPVTITCGSQTIVKEMTFTKSKTGATGSTGNAGANALSLDISGAQVFSYNSAGTVTPASITLTATGKNFTASASNIKWQYHNGTTWVDIATALTCAITPSTTGWSNDMFRVQALYISNTSIKDEFTLYKVRDGKNALTGYIYAPSGTVIHNEDRKSISLEASVFWGGTDKSTSAKFKWEKQSASGTWSTIRDYTSGDGGRKVSIGEADIPNLLNVKCSMQYDGQTFVDTIVLTDYSDPYQAQVISTNGDTFKNGTGTTYCIAKIMRAGEEMDVINIYETTPATSGVTAGTIIYVKADGKYKELVSGAWADLSAPPSKASGKSRFTYTWTRYNENGVPDSTPFATGKIIKVTDANVSQKANFVVQIED